ncbi:uncharacterized protein SCHCODRAFT_02608849 [Schizophyllum commune H4-8]|uniref:uncharacterized protein n=1 Tax=Schizophyllum commune (strain H4-8 / FGSC 9210) TaxID=578458 RepID=UPI0021600F27|nr:uncharacterized protein SCHCODRAFT_02608849 [Schizophyllum commune H4-8]KAI5900813.1 hypothetical protein SCHCODRAFT_02608849 [Schizophyllum commune H4-8]
MHHLPPELLAEIFMHFCELVIQRLLFTNPIPTLEKTITCVCKRWRQIAYGTPQLWIYLVSPKQNIKAYLERYVPLAKDCLLDVHGPSDADMLPAFMTEIRPYASQLRSIALFGSLADFNWLAPYDMPNLEYARILRCADWVEDPSARIAFIKDMPRLQSLYLFLGGLSADVVRFPPMPALTTLIINVSGAAPEILRPLQQCRRTLITLRVAISPDHEGPGAAPPESAPPPLELPALRGLELEFDAERLLRYITAPALETLQFSGRDAGAPVLLLDYLRRAPSTATRLRALDVEHYQVERWPGAALEALAECLAILEGLEILRFRSFHPPQELLQRLTGGEDTLPLLPKLKLGIFGREPRGGARPSKAYKALVRSRATSRSVGGIVVPAALITDSYLLRGKPVQCPP